MFGDYGIFYSTCGPLTPDRMHLSQRGRRALAQELVGLDEKTLTWKEERNKTMLSSEEQ